MSQNAIQRAANIVGSKAEIARLCGVTRQAVHHWAQRGRLPRGCWTGEFQYAHIISAATGGKVTLAELLTFDQ